MILQNIFYEANNSIPFRTNVFLFDAYGEYQPAFFDIGKNNPNLNYKVITTDLSNNEFQHLGSVVTNHGYSDWATTAISADVKTMWYRLSRREDDYCIECSGDGMAYSQMRICHMWEGAGKIRFGVYACSPENSSFKAVFTDLQITECAWKTHDGQQPD